MGRRRLSEDEQNRARERKLQRDRELAAKKRGEEKATRASAGKPEPKRGAPRDPKADVLARWIKNALTSGRAWIEDSEGRRRPANAKDIAEYFGVPPNTLSQAMRRAKRGPKK
jgi:hypothetical protein